MRALLRFAGGFNLAAGVGMICLYHEGYRWLGLTGPELPLPVQVTGVLVGLFGVGYLLVATRPREHYHLLVLGFWSKALSSVLALGHVAAGNLPWRFVPILFLADIVYLPPFWVIMRRIKAATGGPRAG